MDQLRFLVRQRIWKQLAAVITLLAIAVSSHAHPVGFSGLRVVISADAIHVQGTLHTRDLSAWFPPGRYPNYVPDVCAHMQAAPQEIVEVRLEDQPITPSSIRCSS